VCQYCERECGKQDLAEKCCVLRAGFSGASGGDMCWCGWVGLGGGTEKAAVVQVVDIDENCSGWRDMGGQRGAARVSARDEHIGRGWDLARREPMRYPGPVLPFVSDARRRTLKRSSPSLPARSPLHALLANAH
jgi:hypothetical protein